MPDPKRIVLLGATGSIGESTLAVIERHPERFELVGIAANQNSEALDAIAKRFNVPHRSLYSSDGVEGLRQLATLPEADLVLVATTGTIALAPTIAALEAGKTVGLANKETLVLGGEFPMPGSPPRSRGPETDSPHCLGRPVYPSHPPGNGNHLPGRGAQAPELGHGAKGHRRFRHHGQQGA